jgi:hypothetical protein
MKHTLKKNKVQQVKKSYKCYVFKMLQLFEVLEYIGISPDMVGYL